jgi:hypothetical protein
MQEIFYIGSVFLAVTAYAVGVWAVWQVVEGVYWLYCKATGKTY